MCRYISFTSHIFSYLQEKLIEQVCLGKNYNIKQIGQKELFEMLSKIRKTLSCREYADMGGYREFIETILWNFDFIRLTVYNYTDRFKKQGKPPTRHSKI